MKAFNVNNVLSTLIDMELNSGKKLMDVIPYSIINEIALRLTSSLAPSNLDMVNEFNKTFKVEKEEIDDLREAKYKMLRVSLIMEETLELAFALGIERGETYNIFIRLFQNQYSKSPFIYTGEVQVETLDALLDLLVVVYGAFYVFNLEEYTQDGMIEVHKSNMSKICTSRQELVDTVQFYKDKDIAVNAEELPNDCYIVRNRETNKILKSVNYKPVNLIQLLTINP